MYKTIELFFCSQKEKKKQKFNIEEGDLR